MWGQPPPAVRRAQFDSQSREAAQEYSPRREPWESKPEEGKGSERSCLFGAGKDPVMLSEAEGKRSDPPAKSKHPCPLLAPPVTLEKATPTLFHSPKSLLCDEQPLLRIPKRGELPHAQGLYRPVQHRPTAASES